MIRLSIKYYRRGVGGGGGACLLLVVKLGTYTSYLLSNFCSNLSCFDSKGVARDVGQGPLKSTILVFFFPVYMTHMFLCLFVFVVFFFALNKK